jgi:hypothetical protein
MNRSCPVATGPRAVKAVTGKIWGSPIITAAIAAGMVVTTEKTVRPPGEFVRVVKPEHHRPGERVGDQDHRVGLGERPREMHDSDGLKLIRVADGLRQLQGQHPDRALVGIAEQVGIADEERVEDERPGLHRDSVASLRKCSTPGRLTK